MGYQEAGSSGVIEGSACHIRPYRDGGGVVEPHEITQQAEELIHWEERTVAADNGAG